MSQVSCPRPSACAEWCRTYDCYLDDKPAVICGWRNKFATVATLDGKSSFQWAWGTVDNVMRRGRRFYS